MFCFRHRIKNKTGNCNFYLKIMTFCHAILLFIDISELQDTSLNCEKQLM